MRTTILATGLCALALTGTVQAQDENQQTGDVIELKTISVTANRSPTEKNKVGSKIEQIMQEEIETSSRPVVSDYLNLLPGVSVANNGGLGGTSGLFVRGLGSSYVKTLYNGIDVSDPSNTQVKTHYEYLLTGGVRNIEVLKGSQSTLYGSSAIAGVIDLSTLGESEDGIHHTIDAEGGSFGTARGRYGFVAAGEGSKFAANISGLHTDGISAADGFPERDSYENVTLDVAAEHRINEAFSVFGSALYVDAKADFDDVGADSLINRNLIKTMAGRFGVNFDLMDGRLKNTLSVQGFKMERDTFASYGDSEFIGKRGKFDYQGAFEITDRVVLQYGLDHERQTADIDEGTSFTRSTDLTGVWAQSFVELLDNLTLTAGLRHDEHSEFGGHTTYRGTASYLMADTGIRIHTSLGTGFRAPSLYELYAPANQWGPVGDAALQPETSKSFDIGIEQSLLEGRLLADLTYFRIDVENLIIFGSGYEQIAGTTRSEGIEASFTYAARDWLDIGGSYTYTNSKSEKGERNVRIPKHAFVLSIAAKPAEKWTIGADLKYVSDTVDAAYDSVPPYSRILVPLNDYVLLNAKVAYQLTDSTEIYLRGENLLNENYQTAKGYGTPGISAFAGIKAKF